VKHGVEVIVYIISLSGFFVVNYKGIKQSVWNLPVFGVRMAYSEPCSSLLSAVC